jgi:hypothetical protein
MAEWPDDKVTDMVSMRQRGWTATQIGKALNMSRNAISDKLDRLGLTRRRHDRPVQKDTTYVAPRPPSPPRKFSWEQ